MAPQIQKSAVSFPQPGKNDIYSHQTRSLDSKYTKCRPIAVKRILKIYADVVVIV